MKAIVKRQTIVANPRRHKIVVFRSHPGPPGQGSTQALLALQTHIDSPAPHSVYDDLPSMTLLFENGLV